MELHYRLMRAFVRLILRMICRLHVQGLEKLPRQGPMILVTNHLHFLDPPIVMAELPVRSTVLVAEKWEKRPPLSWAFKAIGAVFIRRGAADIDAVRKVQHLLERGAIVGIAPEGTRSPTRSLQRGKGGAAYLGSKTGAAMVPVAVYGHERTFKELRRLRRADVYVIVGEPFNLPAVVGPNKSRQIREMTQEVMLRLARLLPPEYQGIYGSLLGPEQRLEPDLSMGPQ